MRILKKSFSSRQFYVLFVFSIFILFLPFSAKSSEGETYNYNYPSWESPGSWLNKNFYFWFPRRVEDLSNGQITFNEFPGQTLMEGFDQYQSVVDGDVPFAATATVYTIDTMPLASMLDLPAWWNYDEYDKYRNVVQELLDSGLQEYFHDHGVHVFAIGPLDKYTYWTTEESGPVKEPEDAKGIKIRSPGGLASEGLVALGSVPVTLSVGDTITSLERGLIDGVSLTATSVVSLGLTPSLKYWAPHAVSTRATVLIIGNYETYKSYPKSVQKIFDQAGKELEDRWWDEMMKYLNEDTVKKCKEHNVDIITLDDKTQEKFDEKLDYVWDVYKDKYISGSDDEQLGKKLINIIEKHR